MNPLLLLLLLHAASGNEPGQGGVEKQVTLPGRNGVSYKLTFFRDQTVFVETVGASFFTRRGTSQVLKVISGTPEAVRAAVANLPE